MACGWGPPPPTSLRSATSPDFVEGGHSMGALCCGTRSEPVRLTGLSSPRLRRSGCSLGALSQLAGGGRSVLLWAPGRRGKQPAAPMSRRTRPVPSDRGSAADASGLCCLASWERARAARGAAPSGLASLGHLPDFAWIRGLFGLGVWVGYATSALWPGRMRVVEIRFSPSRRALLS